MKTPPTDSGLRTMMAALCALVLLAGPARAGEGLWQLEPRELGPPAGASPELRDFLGSQPQPNPAIRKLFAPADADAWRTLIDAQNTQRAIVLEVLQERTGVAITRETMGGVPVYRIVPNRVSPAHRDHLFLHVHGGAYVFGGGDNAVPEAAVIAGATGIPALSIDYRMPPDHPFPAALDDVIAVYRQVLKERSAKTIVLGGTSAGGGLTLASVHKFKALGLDLPGALFAGTPWADLTKTGDTLFTNEGIDRTLVTYEGMLGSAAELYAAGHDLKDPLISPVYGNFERFPPTYLVTGTRDLFLSDTVRTHRRLREAGCAADLNVYEGMSHAEYLLLAEMPESKEFLTDLGGFLEMNLPRPGFLRRLLPEVLRRN